jgi:N-ethylmaleimide reductase
MLSSDTTPVHPAMREAFGGTFIMNSDYDYNRGMKTIAQGHADAISYGRPFISNPNLPKVFRDGKEPAPGNPETYYTLGAHGYTDYPEI